MKRNVTAHYVFVAPDVDVPNTKNRHGARRVHMNDDTVPDAAFRDWLESFGDALVMEAVAKPSCRDNGRDARYPDVGKAKYLNIGGFAV